MDVQGSHGALSGGVATSWWYHFEQTARMYAMLPTLVLFVVYSRPSATHATHEDNEDQRRAPSLVDTYP
jgi:hypothetical protein